MKIVVTGGAGFIGSCFIRYMLKKHKDIQIVNIDKLTYAGRIENLDDIKNNSLYSFVKGDICDKNVVRKVLKNAYAVVNFAAETHVDRSIAEPEIFIDTNVKGTFNLLQCALEANVKRYLQVSTDEVYGSLDKTGYFYETTPLAPNSPYAASKASADLLALAYYKTFNLPVLITRCSNNYGPYQYPEKLIPFFILKLLQNQKVPLYGDGLNVRDWLYVYDHCEAIDVVLQKGKIGEVYNIGGHNEKTNLEIAKIILKTMNKNQNEIIYTKDRLGHDRRYAISNDKITQQLGWSPSISFEDGIKLTIEWYLNNKTYLRKDAK